MHFVCVNISPVKTSKKGRKFDKNCSRLKFCTGLRMIIPNDKILLKKAFDFFPYNLPFACYSNINIIYSSIANIIYVLLSFIHKIFLT